MIAIFAASVSIACSGERKPSGNGEAIPNPITIKYQVVDTMAHDTTAFTQGLEFHGTRLYESTGQYGNTSIRILNPETGTIDKLIVNSDKTIFGEGITILNNKLYQLTYQNHLAFVFDLQNLEQPLQTLSWPKEGWGMTNDGEHLLLSDGSSTISYVKPGDFTVNRTLEVRDSRGYIDKLNELEYVDGFLYANRWQDNKIYKIDLSTGYVVGLIHLEGIMELYKPDFIKGSEDVLNGIAWHQSDSLLYVTGKNWPLLFKLSLK